MARIDKLPPVFWRAATTLRNTLSPREEVSVTSDIIEVNEAGIDFLVAPSLTEFGKTLYKYAWADTFISAPSGNTATVEDEENQIPGTGAAFEIPLDHTSALFKAIISTGHEITLTPDTLGKSTFDALTDFLRSKYAEDRDEFLSEDGVTYYYVPYSPDELLERFGILIMCRPSGGEEVLDATENFQLGVLYDEEMFEDGELVIEIGTTFVDSDPAGGSYWQDITGDLNSISPTPMEMKMSIIRDGVKDDVIEFSYWLAKKPENSDGGGGGTGALALSGIGLVLLAAWRKRGQRN
ncbi:MAG: hypothetical protein LBS75_06085 [Synergistaceae bacterium]|jgi:hypothetical protein|nr:hypothetical protein [Synergistaceae bacterium]